MPNRFASGKKAIAECDRCGFRYKLKELRQLVIKTKNVNILVCPTCWEPDQPQLQLESRHIYTDGETQLALQKATLELPFSRLYENTFTFAAADYAPLKRSITAIATGTRRLDAVHPAGRLLWFFRSQNDLRAGRRYSFTDPSGNEYYTNTFLWRCSYKTQR